MFITVKHAYNEHTYNELMPTMKWVSFPGTILHAVNLTVIKNYDYNEASI